MREIKIKNELNLKVYFDAVPNFSLLPNDIKDTIISSLEEEITKLKEAQNEYKKSG